MVEKVENQPRTTRPDAIPDEKIAEALKKFKGLQVLAAEALGVTYQAISKRIAASPFLQDVREECHERRLDIGEQSLMKLTEKNDIQAVRFLLSTKGKMRGYGESLEALVSKEVTNALEKWNATIGLLQSSALNKADNNNISDSKS